MKDVLMMIRQRMEEILLNIQLSIFSLAKSVIKNLFLRAFVRNDFDVFIQFWLLRKYLR